MAPASSVAPASRRCTFRRWLILLSGALLMSAAWLTKQTALAAPLTAILALMAGGHRASTGGGHPAPTGGGHPASTGGGHPARLYQQDAGATRGSRHSDPTGGGLRARLRGCQYPIILALLLLLFGAVAWTTLTLATDGWFNRHMQVVAAPSMRPHYTWYMLTRPPAEPQIPYLFILPVLAILTTILPGSGTALGGRPSCPTTPAKRRRHTGEQASYPPLAPDREQPLEGPLDQAEPLHIRALPVAILYFALSLAIALITAMHQGSDRNYLLEPALAAGLLAGAWADRVARVPLTRDWLLTRTAAAAALLSPMLLDLPDRFARTDADSRHQANSVSPYSDEALAWLRRLPKPMLCLDSWLAWRAGVANDLNDSVAYGSYVMTGRPDPITRRAENRHYACIVTMTPAGESADPLYGDIPSLWPGLRRALLEKYTLLSNHGPWHAYTPNTEALPPIGSQPDQAEPQRRRPEAGGPNGFGEEPINNLTETVTMNATSRARVLDVGQCNMDHSAIRSLITTRFDADVDRAHSIEEAIAAMRNSRYDLVLVNRILDADGREGLELIHQAQADEQLKTVPVMMVSNYADAQAAAVAAGARQGFGKSQLFEASTAEALARVLPGKPANVR